MAASKLAVGRILGDGKRQRTRAFAELQSHYLFLDRFGRPAGKGNGRRNLGSYARRNFLVPIPTFASFAELNAHLEQRCLERLDHRVRGHAGEHWQAVGLRGRARQFCPRGSGSVRGQRVGGDQADAARARDRQHGAGEDRRLSSCRLSWFCLSLPTEPVSGNSVASS